MTPPLCPLCHRRASERMEWVFGMYPEEKHLVRCPSPFHDAGDWGPALLEALTEARDEILASAGDEGVVTAIDNLLSAIEGREEGKRWVQR
jgi:hypothetical protein